ncbi:MAG: primosomal protein N', partial [Nitrospinota bacterium]
MNPSEKTPEYVEVAVPLPVDRTFTYRVPDSIGREKRLALGGRVRVPFAGRVLTGHVVAPAERPPGRDVLDVLTVLDDGLVVTGEVLRLTRW